MQVTGIEGHETILDCGLNAVEWEVVGVRCVRSIVSNCCYGYRRHSRYKRQDDCRVGVGIWWNGHANGIQIQIY